MKVYLLWEWDRRDGADDTALKNAYVSVEAAQADFDPSLNLTWVKGPLDYVAETWINGVNYAIEELDVKGGE